ncbi:hypothetical protein, partial [Burkholderia pseudomallei]|uniref:hypothetical protein n=1 Tax=Burkholderia pseudomallei TaxID=28450 RepID=UPI003AF64CAE
MPIDTASIRPASAIQPGNSASDSAYAVAVAPSSSHSTKVMPAPMKNAPPAMTARRGAPGGHRRGARRERSGGRRR